MNAYALPSRYYIDADVFTRARERVFFSNWQYACHESQIEAHGSYHAFSLFEQDILLVRDNDGTLRGFYNVCQHRGHTLVENGEGQVKLLTCPYHKWTYELNGGLRAAPGGSKNKNFIREEICLTQVRVETFLGFVFVNLDDSAASMNELYPDVADAVTKLCPDIKAQRFAFDHHAVEDCNWLVAVANYNECYHCKNAHQAFSKGVVDPESYDIQQFSSGRVLRHSARAAKQEEAWYESGAGEDEKTYGSFYLYPGFSLQIYPGGLANAYHWRPLNVETTRVYRSWFSPDGKVDARLQEVIDLDRDTTFAEDLALVKSTQRGLHSRGYRPSALMISPEGAGIDSEHSIALLHGWVEKDLA